MKKINQNAIVKIGNNFVITTNTKLFIYSDVYCKNLIGFAGVKNPKDFDFYALYKIAQMKSGSKIQVA